MDRTTTAAAAAATAAAAAAAAAAARTIPCEGSRVGGLKAKRGLTENGPEKKGEGQKNKKEGKRNNLPTMKL